MGRSNIFIRRRDGRIEVRLTPEGREFVREQFARLRVAEADETHEWHSSLSPPIDPGRDADDPLRTFERQRAMASNAELALLTVDEPFLSEGEGWSWLTSLQLALRAVAEQEGLATAEDVERSTPAELAVVHGLQILLFELADALS